MSNSRSSTAVCIAILLFVSQALLAQSTTEDARKAYLQFTNQFAKANFRLAAEVNEASFHWEVDGKKLWFNYSGVRGLLDTRSMRVIEASDIAVRMANRAGSKAGSKSPPSQPVRNLNDMETKAKEISSSFGWEITGALAPAWTFSVSNHFSSHLADWAFRWHRKVNGFRLFHERVQVFISDKGLDLESFKSTLTTNSYDFPVGPLLTTNALHEAILKHVKLNHPTLLERGTPDNKMPARLIVKEFNPPRQLYVVEADYTQRWHYPTPTKGPKGKPKEPRLAWHLYYAIHDGTPGRGEKVLHQDFGCFDAITGDALMHDW